MGEFVYSIDRGPERAVPNTWHSEGASRLWARAFGDFTDTVTFWLGLTSQMTPKTTWHWPTQSRGGADLGKPASIPYGTGIAAVLATEGGSRNAHHLRVMQYHRQPVDLVVEECSDGVIVRTRNRFYDEDDFNVEASQFRNRGSFASIPNPYLKQPGIFVGEYAYEPNHSWPWSYPYHYRGSVGNVLGHSTTDPHVEAKIFYPAWKEVRLTRANSQIRFKPTVGTFEHSEDFETDDLVGMHVYYCTRNNGTGKVDCFRGFVNTAGATTITTNDNTFVTSGELAYLSVRPADATYEEMDKNGFRAASLPLSNVFLMIGYVEDGQPRQSLVASAALAEYTRLNPGAELSVLYRGMVFTKP